MFYSVETRSPLLDKTIFDYLENNKTKILQPIDKNDFLDIGHMGNSAIQTQRVSEARDLLIGGYEDGNAVVQNYINNKKKMETFKKTITITNYKKFFNFKYVQRIFTKLDFLSEINFCLHKIYNF